MSSVVIKSADRTAISRAVMSFVEALRQNHPEVQRVIWFGSWVNGTPTPRSDVDLCLILSHSRKPARERIADYLPVGFPVGMDLFCYTQEELERLRKRAPSLYAAIISGRDLTWTH